MACAELRPQVTIFGQWQQRAGIRDAPARINNDRAIMQFVLFYRYEQRQE